MMRQTCIKTSKHLEREPRKVNTNFCYCEIELASEWCCSVLTVSTVHQCSPWAEDSFPRMQKLLQILLESLRDPVLEPLMCPNFGNHVVEKLVVMMTSKLSRGAYPGGLFPQRVEVTVESMC